MKNEVKALFPDDIETITISKNDYDRLYGTLTAENIELKLEVKRLNNIINELEKYAEEEIIEGNKRPEDYARFGIEDYVKGQVVAFKHMLDKLKELKGSDSNE